MARLCSTLGAYLRSPRGKLPLSLALPGHILLDRCVAVKDIAHTGIGIPLPLPKHPLTGSLLLGRLPCSLKAFRRLGSRPLRQFLQQCSQEPLGLSIGNSVRPGKAGQRELEDTMPS
jgi:hypothetical protein